jgi:RNA polymerase sporulation-specific sigma factor
MLDIITTNNLIIKAKNGDEFSKSIIFENNEPLIKSIIRRFKNKGVEYDDLYQIACIGFLKSINNFDESFGVKFSTYTVPMIIGEIKRYLRDNNMVRVSRSVRDLAYRVLQAKETYLKEKGKEATIEELSKILEVEKEDIVMSLDAIQDPISLQEPVYNDGDDSIYIMDQVRDKKNTDEKWAENITINEALKRLNEKEKMIINKRFFNGKTQMEVAEEIGISQAQVSRLEKTAIDHIRRYYK